MSKYKIIKIGENVLEVDVDATEKYYNEHSLCDCSEDRNFYESAEKRFPELTKFLSQMGVSINRPDEIGSSPLGDMIDYHFVAYTVIGKIQCRDKYETDLFDNGSYLNIVIDNWYVPNEQKTEEYFTVTIYNIRLPWVLNEPFPEEKKDRDIFSEIKKFFHK